MKNLDFCGCSRDFLRERFGNTGFESFVHHVTAPQAKPMQSEPERELISSSIESSGLSRLFFYHVT